MLGGVIVGVVSVLPLLFFGGEGKEMRKVQLQALLPFEEKRVLTQTTHTLTLTVNMI